MSLFLQLIHFIRNLFHKKIPFEVHENEVLVRGIVHPMFYSESKNAVKPEAFLPPPNRRDVSLLRHSYTDDDFCKNHSMKLVIGTNKYCGMATFCHYHILEMSKGSLSEKILAIRGTPMDSQGNYIEKPPVYINTPGLPMHADLLYEKPLVKGEVNTAFRKYANDIAKTCIFFKDPFPNEPNWKGSKLLWK